jgi:putative transposase
MGFAFALPILRADRVRSARTGQTRPGAVRRDWEHTIRDESDFARHVDYIHINPVKHGLVTRVRDWPFSSFHRMVNFGVYAEDWAGDVANDDEEFGERP